MFSKLLLLVMVFAFAFYVGLVDLVLVLVVMLQCLVLWLFCVALLFVRLIAVGGGLLVLVGLFEGLPLWVGF